MDTRDTFNLNVKKAALEGVKRFAKVAHSALGNIEHESDFIPELACLPSLPSSLPPSFFLPFLPSFFPSFFMFIFLHTKYGCQNGIPDSALRPQTQRMGKDESISYLQNWLSSLGQAYVRRDGWKITAKFENIAKVPDVHIVTTPLRQPKDCIGVPDLVSGRNSSI